jgi:magnesium transporter
MTEEKFHPQELIEVDNELIEDMLDLIRSKSDLLLKNIISDLYPADIAHIINKLEFDDGGYLFSLLTIEEAGKVIVELDDDHREHFLSTLKSEQISDIVEELPTDEATDIVSELSDEKAEEVLDDLNVEDSYELQELLKYDKSSAGGLMQKEVIAVHTHDTVKKAIQAVRREAKEHGEEHLYNVFVVDDQNIVVGWLPVANLILLTPNRKMHKVMNIDLITLKHDIDQEEVARIFKKYNAVSLPVVDHIGRLLGKITVDDIVDVMEEEASEDILRLGGVGEDEHISTPPIIALRRRLPWLYVNLLTAFLAASVVSLFQHTIEKVVVLAALMPIVAGMGGNAATQTITVMVRGLALGEVTNSNRKKVFWKELQIGLMNGAANGLLTGTVIGIFTGIPMLGVVICLAMITNMFVAGCAGTLVPLVLKWLKIDPALASAVVVTTFTDVFGFASFLGLATLFITLLM